jgi:O-antigen ligase
LAFTYSRAGMALGLVAGLSCVALAGPLSAGKSRRTILRVVAGASLLALLIAFQFGFVTLSQRVEGQGLTDLRWSAAAITLQAASANLPLGTGFGTFIPVYEMFAPRTLLSEWYVNHAHDDWLELALEGGVPAVAILLLFLCWFTIASMRVWRKPDVKDRALDRVLARAASIVIILLLVHSALDFPLRATTMMTIFAISCALMIDAAWPKPARGLASGGIEGSASSGPRERPQILRV